ncbi:MAG: hypothetical protein R6U26_01840 [Candidatus Undinarchaeales archaeon]
MKRKMLLWSILSSFLVLSIGAFANAMVSSSNLGAMFADYVLSIVIIAVFIVAIDGIILGTLKRKGIEPNMKMHSIALMLVVIAVILSSLASFGIVIPEWTYTLVFAFVIVGSVDIVWNAAQAFSKHGFLHSEEQEIRAEAKRLREEGYRRAAKEVLKMEKTREDIIERMKDMENELNKMNPAEAAEMEELEEKEEAAIEIEAVMEELEDIYGRHNLADLDMSGHHFKNMMKELLQAKFAIDKEVAGELKAELEEAEGEEKAINTKLDTLPDGEKKKKKELEKELDFLNKKIHTLKILLEEEYEEGNFDKREKRILRKERKGSAKKNKSVQQQAKEKIKEGTEKEMEKLKKRL